MEEVKGMIYLLQHLLINSAKRYPDKDAVVCSDERITYRGLDEVTNKLAVVLNGNGVKRGDRVGIYINKSIPSIISIHGILKAGATYVPLDPNAPPSRLAYIIQNCGIKCLLTSSKKIEKLYQMFPEENPLEVMVLTDDLANQKGKFSGKLIQWKEVLFYDESSLREIPTIETDLAYILYTSGSTGVPKGVMISHLNALTFVNWAYEAFSVNSEDRLSNHAPLHFDLSIFDIFVAFKAGATLGLVPEGISIFPIKMAEWIERNRISVWYSVPSALTMMVLQGKLDRYKFSNLHTIIFAGEVFPVKYLRQLMASITHAKYYNIYGPTETNVITCYQVPKIPPDQIKPVPIGRACANMEVFALTDDGKLVTRPSQEGELYARGSCVARGYWGDEEKTNKNFIVNPIQPHFNERIYNTGDLVTLDQEGNYLFLGRRDHMIKSRGYRIELGDIEANLYNHPEVNEAAVIAIADDLIGNKIKAYIVLNNNKKVSSIDLKRFCSERMPKYMVPEIIEFRESLPKTSTGKIDKPTLISQP
jgi:amino acid adenylation domain-containing protein